MAKTKRVRLWTPETGLTVYTHITYRPDDQDSTLTILDSTDGKFRETSVSPYSALTEHATVKGLYVLDEDVTEWKDGFYEARFWSQLAGAPAPSTDDILAVRPTRVKITFDTLLAVFETTDVKKVMADAAGDIIAALGTVVNTSYEGTATSGSNTTIADTGALWDVDIWASTADIETICILTSLASGIKYAVKIVSNTADTLTVDALSGGYLAVVGDTYAIIKNSSAVDIKSIGGTAQTGGDMIALLTTIDTDTSDIATDTGNIYLDTTDIAVDTGTIASDTTNILADTTAILLDTANMDTNLATVAGDTTNILADTNAILLDTANIDTNIGTLVTNTTAPTTPVIYNISIAVAGTEYSQALPANTKKFALSIIDGTIGENFRFAYETGKVATPTAPYRQLDQGFEYSQDGVSSSATVYIAASNICVAQLEVWS